MKDLLNILVISGEGQNVGKTLLACDIISKFSRTHNIAGLKITPHRHQNTGDAQIIKTIGKSVLLEETNPHSKKDTGRMLAAGAEKAFLLQSADEDLDNALDWFTASLDEDMLVVCESGKIPADTKVGISFFVRHLNCQVCIIDKKLPHPETNRIVTYAVNGFDIDLNTIEIKNNKWILIRK